MPNMYFQGYGWWLLFFHTPRQHLEDSIGKIEELISLLDLSPVELYPYGSGSGLIAQEKGYGPSICGRGKKMILILNGNHWGTGYREEDGRRKPRYVFVQ